MVNSAPVVSSNTKFLIQLVVILIPVSAVCSLLFSRIMRSVALGQWIREYGPNIHLKKSGTPTMGGAVILILWGLSMTMLAYRGILSEKGLFIFLSGLGFGLIGLTDDLVAVCRRRSLGLSATMKILLSTALVAVLVGVFFSVVEREMLLPFSSVTVKLPSLAMYLFVWFVFLSTTNGMNLADGLDGLATGVTLITLAGFLFVLGPGQVISVIPLLGILIGFLWVNGFPATLFLGDVGSFALGGAVGAIAVVSGTEFFLPLLAGLLVLEATSVIMQVSYYKIFGVRIFKVSPLHHHFEQAEGVDYRYLLPATEWPEAKITARLWILQVLFVGLAVLGAKI